MWWKISLVVIVAMALFFVLGLYAGGALYLVLIGLEFSSVSWSTLFDASSQSLSDRSLMFLPWAWCVTVLFTFLPVALTLLAIFMRPKVSNLHGDARFANNAELRIFEYKGEYQ